jgi:ligand-binding sensor domain-containing protein
MNAFSISTILSFSILSNIFTSCNGQNNPQTVNRNFNKSSSVIAIGDTVSEMDMNVWYIHQDRNNNFWFGSNGQGVYRYDGKTIVHFSTKDGLSNNHIKEIKEDHAGNIYFTTWNGISKFDGQKFIKLTIAADSGPSKWKLEPNDLWFKGEGQMKGPYRYDGKALYRLEFPKHNLEDAYYKQYPNTSINPYDLYYIYKDNRGTMWFGTGALGIYRYDGKSLRSMYEEHLTLTESGGSFGIRSIMEDKKGKFWFCNTKYRYTILPNESTASTKGLVTYTKEKGIDISNSLLSSDRIYFQSIVEDSTGNIWMQTYQEGILRYDGKKVTRYPVKDGAIDIKVISMYKDKRGGLWLGTDGAGVYKFNGRTFEKFRPFQPN